MNQKNRITVAAYPKSEIPERYFDCRSDEQICFRCSHFTARCDLRRDKRYIVPLEHGECALKKFSENCRSYERIPELRAENMNPLERFYYRMYTKRYLAKVLKWFFSDQKILFSRNCCDAETWATRISTYQKAKKSEKLFAFHINESR